MKETTILKTTIGRLRAVGITEGISFIVLLGIAMPLKYYAGLPMAVKVVGWLHGLLFILYLAALLHVTIAQRWSIWKVLLAFIASLVPFGTFLLDARLKKEELGILEDEKIINRT
jgi:integral membrane protein